MKIVFREKCQVDKYEMVFRVINHAEFEYGHENYLEPQNFCRPHP